MGSKHHQNLSLLSMLIVLSGLSLAVAAPSPAAFDLFPRNVTTETPEPLDCTTDFSGDYYGFGVRLGVYFAWLSSYFANTLLPSEIAGSLDTNSIFLLGLLTSLFSETLYHELFQIDGLIIMQLSSGFLFSSLSLWGYRTSQYQKDGPTAIQNFGKFGTHCRLALAVAISLYGTWFWWEGLDDGLLTAEDERCRKIYTWFFAELPVRGGIDILYIIISFSCAVYYGMMALAAVVAFVAKLIRVGWNGKMVFETGFSIRELKVLFNIFRIFNLFWIIFCAAMIEMTLSKNHMIQVLAQHGEIAYPAQLIPLIVGVLSFVRVVWLIYAEWKEGNGKSSGTNNKTVTREKHTIYNPYYFGLDTIKQVFSSSAQPEKNIPTFEVDQPNMPAILRPWHHRYAVALIPWLSTFDAWRISDGGSPSSLDVERSSVFEESKGTD